MRTVFGKRVGQAGRGGFTLAELLVASVVMSTALLGVNAMFRHALDTEGRAAVRWHDRAAADGVAAHLAEALAQSINLPEMPALVAESDSDTDGWVICQVGLERRRYRWQMVDSGPHCVLELQKMIVAGTRNLSQEAVGQEETTNRQIWGRIGATAIASRLDGLSVRFKSLESESATWQSDWDGPVGQVVALIQVTVGDETVERVAYPRVRGHLLGGGS